MQTVVELAQKQAKGIEVQTPKHGMKTLHDIVESFLLHQRKAGGWYRNGVSAQTIYTYERLLGLWVRHCGSFEPAALDEYFTRLKDKPGRTERGTLVTRAKHYRHLRKFFGWAERAYGLANPLRILRDDDILPTPKPPKVLQKRPTREVFEAMLKACGSDWAGKRNRVILYLLGTSLLRRHEILKLRCEDVDLQARTIQIRGKGDKPAVIPLFADTIPAIRAWFDLRHALPEERLVCKANGDPLTPDYITHIVKRIARRAGAVSGSGSGVWGPHSLRRFGACEVLDQTGDIVLCQKLLRHETLDMTRLYAELVNKQVREKFRTINFV